VHFDDLVWALTVQLAPPVVLVGGDQTLGASVAPPVLLPGPDHHVGVGRVDGDEWLDLAVADVRPPDVAVVALAGGDRARAGDLNQRGTW
jgi:hypothetical protein